MQKTEGFSEFFKNIDIFVFSHHGDGHNGELNLYGVVFDPSQKRIPLFFIISSNPGQGNHILKSEVLRLGAQSKPFEVMKRYEVSAYSLATRKIEAESVSVPIYVTRDSMMAYRLTIPSNGEWTKLRNVDFTGKSLKWGHYPP
jgi:hypothetical protein